MTNPKPFFIRLPWPLPGVSNHPARKRAWLNDCLSAAVDYPLPSFSKPELLALELRCCPTDGRQHGYIGLAADLTLQALSYINTIEDPRQVQSVTIHRGPQGHPGFIDLRITPLPEPTGHQ
jgi:hypothetical protein